MIIKPEKAIVPLNTNNLNVTRKSYKEVLLSIDHDIVFILPENRLYQKKGEKRQRCAKIFGRNWREFIQDMDNMLKQINIIIILVIETGVIYLYHRSSNKNNPYLPSIYRNKYNNNSVNKYAISKKNIKGNYYMQKIFW